jgi:hypothetical protein
VNLAEPCLANARVLACAFVCFLGCDLYAWFDYFAFL